jgi:hypothetical protein
MPFDFRLTFELPWTALLRVLPDTVSWGPSNAPLDESLFGNAIAGSLDLGHRIAMTVPPNHPTN